VFVGGTCGSVDVESFNRIMKALGVLESKWDPIRKKLVRHLLEEQDQGANSARRPELNDQIVIKGRAGKLGVVPDFCLVFVEFIKLS